MFFLVLLFYCHHHHQHVHRCCFQCDYFSDFQFRYVLRCVFEARVEAKIPFWISLKKNWFFSSSKCTRGKSLSCERDAVRCYGRSYYIFWHDKKLPPECVKRVCANKKRLTELLNLNIPRNSSTRSLGFIYLFYLFIFYIQTSILSRRLPAPRVEDGKTAKSISLKKRYTTLYKVHYVI